MTTTLPPERSALLKTFIEAEVYEQLVQLAREHERSLAGEIRVAIRRYVEEERE